MCPSPSDTGGQPGREMLDNAAMNENRLVNEVALFFPPCILLLDIVLSLLMSILEFIDVPFETYYYITTKLKWFILY